MRSFYITRVEKFNTRYTNQEEMCCCIMHATDFVVLKYTIPIFCRYTKCKIWTSLHKLILSVFLKMYFLYNLGTNHMKKECKILLTLYESEKECNIKNVCKECTPNLWI